MIAALAKAVAKLVSLNGAALGDSGSVRGMGPQATSSAAICRRPRSLLHSPWSNARPLRLEAGVLSPSTFHGSSGTAYSPCGIRLPQVWRGCASSPAGDWDLSHSPGFHQNLPASPPQPCTGVHQKGWDLEGVEGATPPNVHSLNQ